MSGHHDTEHESTDDSGWRGLAALAVTVLVANTFTCQAAWLAAVFDAMPGDFIDMIVAMFFASVCVSPAMIIFVVSGIIVGRASKG